MIIDFDHNQNISYEQKLQSLKESVQMALNEIEDKLNKQREQIDAIANQNGRGQ